jgi:(2Fe-2S) ferredoxin
MAYLEGELADRGMDDYMVSSSGCLKACTKGPVMVVYPDGHWVGGVDSHEKIDTILDALQASNAPEGSF